ncbi:hypothetical protein THAOC_25848 [Thalassiosira oceanica]|uniref:Uncharacterized protein n=1 Tax=Thalassiosira oceanica TaxID=159749 RepID=K0RQ86_THAOC|nr:hypothetical protein THAOC_25848 [Thalassiosira oceanica]|eukprot:EJK54519.1 hypothetical protein THAOC_25848 [Thalassiosira oceanica]
MISSPSFAILGRQRLGQPNLTALELKIQVGFEPFLDMGFESFQNRDGRRVRSFQLPIVIFSTRPIGPDPPRGTKIIKDCGSNCFYEAGRKFTSAGPISHGETPCRRRDAPWVSGGRPGHLSGMTVPLPASFVRPKHRLPPRPERRRHESSDEDDDGSDSVDAAGRVKRMPSGNRSGLQDAGDLAAAERKLRERQRRREVDSAANEADLAWTEREREERQLRSNKGARQRELEDLEAAELAAISSMTVARGIDNQYLESQKNAESRPWRRTLGKKREEESAGTDGALEADGEETRRQRRKISPRPRREVADVQGASSVSGLAPTPGAEEDGSAVGPGTSAAALPRRLPGASRADAVSAVSAGSSLAAADAEAGLPQARGEARGLLRDRVGGGGATTARRRCRRRPSSLTGMSPGASHPGQQHRAQRGAFLRHGKQGGRRTACPLLLPGGEDGVTPDTIERGRRPVGPIRDGK